jgi:carbamoyl-phosphate synthase large subunit
MKSTGEVMGIDDDFGMAFMKSQIAAGQKLPADGKIFISVNDQDKRKIIDVAKRLANLSYEIVATSGTADVLRKSGLTVEEVAKLDKGRPDIIDLIKDRKVSLLINTPGGKQTKADETKIRSLAIMQNLPLITTLSGARATATGLEAAKKKGFPVKALQDYH